MTDEKKNEKKKNAVSIRNGGFLLTPTKQQQQGESFSFIIACAIKKKHLTGR